MNDNKNQTDPIVFPSTNAVISSKPQSITSSGQTDAAPPVSDHSKTRRIVNILYALIVIPNVLLFIYGVSNGSNESGAGWAILGAAFWVVVATIAWLILLLILWFIERSPKANSQTVDALQAKQKRKAYISLVISLGQCLLFAALAVSVFLIGKIPDGVIGVLLLISMFAGPVLSWLVILGIIYAIQVFRTPYKKIGIWALALQAISLGAVGMWALVDSML
jgi:hypothetical protein